MFIVLTFSIQFVQQKDLFCLVKAPKGRDRERETEIKRRNEQKDKEKVKLWMGDALLGRW